MSKTKIILGVVVIGLVVAALAMSNTKLFKGSSWGFRFNRNLLSIQPVNPCIETDNGINFRLKGTVTLTQGQTTINEDRCNGDELTEYFCSGAANVDVKVVKCPDGACVDGACTADVPPDSCTETDGGDDINVVGRTIWVKDGFEVINDDFCQNRQIFEFYCNGLNVGTSTRACGGGKICSNGACIFSLPRLPSSRFF